MQAIRPLRRTFITPRGSALALLLSLVAAGSLVAHALLRHSTPAAGARLAAAPRELRLTFSEAPELAETTIELLDARGAAVALGPLAKPDARTVLAPVSGAVAPGDYTVVWHTAAADGHASHGRFSFTVLAPAGAPPPMPRPGGEAAGAVTAPGRAPPPMAHHMLPPGEENEFDVSSPAYVVVRWILFAGLLAAVGAAAFRLFVLGAIRRRPRAEAGALEPELARRAASLGLVAAVLVLLAALARLVAESVAMHGAAHAFDPDRLGMLVGSTVWGWGWLVQLVGAVLCIVGFALARRGGTGAWALAAIAAVALAASPALSGHAAAAPRLTALAIVADSGHVLGAAGWLGSLLALLVAALPLVRARPGAMAELVHAFSPTALFFAGLTVTSGVFSAWLHVGSIPALWSSGYGRTLLVKLVVVTLTAATGAYNWLRVRPALGTAEATLRLRRSAGLELAIGIGILLVTAILVALPTPVSD